MIAFVANTIYKKKYATHSMNHLWQMDDDGFKVEYGWKVDGEWNHLKAIASGEPQAIAPGSEEEFITEHYWGYTFVNENCTGVYEVAHPKWRVRAVKQYNVKCSVARLYGKEFAAALHEKPRSVFLAEGSEIKVMPGTRLFS